MPHKAGNGAVLGIASEDGLPSAKRIVLMDRSNLSIVAKTVADDDGAYAFTGLNPDTDDYLAFAVDDDGSPTKSAIIYDKIRPISAHMGGFYWGNWYLLSMAKEPLVQILGLTDGNDVMTGGAGRGTVIAQGASVVKNQQSLTKGASSLPATKLNEMSIARNALNQHNLLNNQSQNKVSCEWVLDTNDISQTVCVSLARHPSLHRNNSYYAYTSVILQLRYDGKKLQMYHHNGKNYSSDGSILISYLVMCCEYDMSAQGVVHIVGSIHYGENASLCVNGKRVAQSNLAGENVKSSNGSDQRSLSAFIHGDINKNRYSAFGFPTSTTTGPVAFYADTISDDEAMAHYQALMTDTLPQATGYVKAVVQDYPTYLYRLNDLQESLFVKDRLRDNAQGNGHELTKVGGLQATTETLVKGGGGMLFRGGGVRSNMLHLGVHSPNFLTVEFIAKPDSQTVSNWQMLISHARGGQYHFEVRRHNITGKWCLQWRENNAEYLANFTSEIDTQMHHYAFVVDKVQGQCLLYIDGVLAQILSVTKLAMMVEHNHTETDESLSIGGRVNNALSSVAYPYYGYLAEVAIYPFALNQAQISEHVQAMSVL